MHIQLKCVITKHTDLRDAYTVYLGNALCLKHFHAAKDFVKGCKNPPSSYSVVDVLESQAQAFS